MIGRWLYALVARFSPFVMKKGQPKPRAHPLDKIAKAIWVKQHIPHRLRSLVLAAKGEAVGYDADLALIHARWCSQLLGIQKRKDKVLFAGWSHNDKEAVLASDLDGSNADPANELEPHEQRILLTLLIRADRAVAHPTSKASGIQNTPDEQEAYDSETRHVLIEGSKILIRLLQSHIPSL